MRALESANDLLAQQQARDVVEGVGEIIVVGGLYRFLCFGPSNWASVEAAGMPALSASKPCAFDEQQCVAELEFQHAAPITLRAVRACLAGHVAGQVVLAVGALFYLSLLAIGVSPSVRSGRKYHANCPANTS